MTQQKALHHKVCKFYLNFCVSTSQNYWFPMSSPHWANLCREVIKHSWTSSEGCVLIRFRIPLFAFLRLRGLYTDAWPNTEEPALWDSVQLFICISMWKVTSGLQGSHLRQEGQMVWARSKRGHFCFLERPSLHSDWFSFRTTVSIF